MQISTFGQFNWMSAYCGWRDNANLSHQAEVLDAWQYDNCGNINVKINVERARAKILNYLKSLLSDGVEDISLDDIAKDLNYPVKLVEQIINEQKMEIYEEGDEE